MALHATVPLDDDVAEAIQDEARRSGRSFAETLNKSLRASLHLRKQDAVPPFRVRARALNAHPGVKFDKISELLERLEGPYSR